MTAFFFSFFKTEISIKYLIHIQHGDSFLSAFVFISYSEYSGNAQNEVNTLHPVPLSTTPVLKLQPLLRFEVNHTIPHMAATFLSICLYSYLESLCTDLWRERLNQASPVLALQAPNPIIHFHCGQEFRIRLRQRLCTLSGVNRAGTTSRLSVKGRFSELLYNED